MKGWVTLTDSDIDLFSKAVEVIDNNAQPNIILNESGWW